MTMGEPDGEKGDSSRPKKKRKVTCKEHRQTRAQAPASQQSLPSPSSSEANVFDMYRLREMLEAVSRSLLKSFLRLLKTRRNAK